MRAPLTFNTQSDKKVRQKNFRKGEMSRVQDVGAP